MILIDPERDWWPYLKCVKVKMYGRFLSTPEDVVRTWEMTTTINKDTRFDDISKRPTISWGFSKIHGWIDLVISGFNDSGNQVYGLMFVITALHTKTGVILKDDDVVSFIDPYFNRMLYNESIRRGMRSKGGIPSEDFMKRIRMMILQA